MSKIRFIIVATLFILLSTIVLAQDKPEKSDDDLQRKIKLAEQILRDANALRLSENRTVVFAQIGGSLCKTDEKQSLELFQKSVAELIRAQQEAEGIKKNPYLVEQLVYGQQPRMLILEMIAACDPELALDALIKTRPARILQLMAQKPDASSGRQYYTISETQIEQQYIQLIAEKSPERAIELLRASLKNGITAQTLPLLQSIFAKDPKTANKLAEEIAQKLAGENLGVNDYQTSSLVQSFLQVFGEPKTDEKRLEISETTLKNLADKYSAFWLAGENYDYDTGSVDFKLIEKFFPTRAAQIKKKQSPSTDGEYSEYEKLIESGASPEELMKQAEKFPNYKTAIYSNAAQKLAESGNVADAVNIINSKFSDEEAELQLSSFYTTLAGQEIAKENYDQAGFFINQIPNDQMRLNMLIQLGQAVYQKSPKDNKNTALAILNQAVSLVDTSEITQLEIYNLTAIAAAFADIEPAQAFRTIEILVPSMNEFARAYVVVSQFRNEGIQRSGEYLITQNGGITGAYNLGAILQTLSGKDFDRTMQLIDSFDRGESRIAFKLDIIKRLTESPTDTVITAPEDLKGE